MKIKKLKLKNFAQFTDLECEFDGRITRLVGVNGSGKSMIGLTSIWACLKGIAEKSKDGQLIGERFRFIGNNQATADIELLIIDESRKVEIVVKNHISKAFNKITFKAPQGYPVSQEWLNNLLNVAFLSAKHFSILDGKQQAVALGINTDTYDVELIKLKNEYTLINREYRNFGDLVPKEKQEEVDINKLIERQQEIFDFNEKQQEIIRKKLECRDVIKRYEERFFEIKEEIDDLQERLKQKEKLIAEKQKEFDSLPDPISPMDSNAILERIQKAQDINRQAIAYNAYLKTKKQKDLKKKQADENKEKQENIINKRLAYIKSFNFNFEDLEVGEDGGLLLKGRPIREPYFSRSELEIIVSKLYSSLNPKLKVRFIDDFELFDEKNQQKIIDDLLAADFQIITAEVGDEAVKENTILLRECKIVENHKKKKDRLF